MSAKAKCEIQNKSYAPACSYRVGCIITFCSISDPLRNSYRTRGYGEALRGTRAIYGASYATQRFYTFSRGNGDVYSIIGTRPGRPVTRFNYLALSMAQSALQRSDEQRY